MNLRGGYDNERVAVEEEAAEDADVDSDAGARAGVGARAVDGVLVSQSGAIHRYLATLANTNRCCSPISQLRSLSRLS